MTSRRGFLLGFGALLAAPAIIKAESLMKIVVPKKELITKLEEPFNIAGGIYYNVADSRLYIFDGRSWSKKNLAENKVLMQPDVMFHVVNELPENIRAQAVVLAS